jgi:hypothetical protein
MCRLCALEMRAEMCKGSVEKCYNWLYMCMCDAVLFVDMCMCSVMLCCLWCNS